MIRNFSLQSLVFLLLVFPFYQAYAETVLFFAPTRIHLSDKDTIEEIRVTNTSNSPRSYILSLHDLVMTEAGVTTRADGFEFSAKRMIRFVPREFDVAPGKTQIVRIMARISPVAEEGQYHSHLEFLENIKRSNELVAAAESDSKARIKAQIAYATAIPVTITKGEVKTEIDMTDLALRQNEQGEYMLSMVLGRKGNGQGNAIIEADYISPDGEVKKAAGSRPVYIYREIDRRDHSFVLEAIDSSELKKGGELFVKLYNMDVSDTDPVKEMKLSIN